MVSPSTRPAKFRFGAYELDASCGELRKAGVLLKLHPQPFRVLSLLVERAGQMVTREEIRQALWDADTFVEFERGINFCISQIRAVLSDDAEKPRYVETLPRRGYRFIAPLIAPVYELAVAGVGARPMAVDAAERREVPMFAAAAVMVVLAFGIFLLVRASKSRPVILSSRAITHDARPKGTYATLATDGVRVYLQESVAGRSFIAQVSATGGETEEIRVALPVATIYDISPDGANLLLGALGGDGIEMWIQPLPSGPLRRVGNLRADDGGWAPDGRHLVYADGDSVFWAKADGSESRLLAKTGGAPAWPRVSPDGGLVRFTIGDTTRSSSSLWEVSTDGSGLHEMLSQWSGHGNECCGSWTHDGEYFVFQSEREGATNLFVLREGNRWLSAGEAEPTQLTSGPLNFNSPRPSSDGSTVFAIGQQIRSELVCYDVKTGAFAPYLGGISATDVRISPDAQWAAYVAYPEGTLWRSRIDGSERLQLTFPPMFTVRPTWSPDGKRIAWTAVAPGKRPAVYVIDAAGGSARRIGPDGATGFDWSPDGKSAVLNVSVSNVKVARRGTSDEIEILDLSSEKTFAIPDSLGKLGPQWSADGRYLLAKTSDDHHMMLFDMAAQNWTELARADVVTNVRWSRDGQFAYFEQATSQGSALMRVRMAGRKIERVMDFRNIRRPLVTLSTAWSGFTDDGAPLLQRDVGSQEIYRLEWKLP
jgi:Tol biopolymer transport system component/DNA-binding winged helix-turn-helix (wHTH) protein